MDFIGKLQTEQQTIM